MWLSAEIAALLIERPPCSCAGWPDRSGPSPPSAEATRRWVATVCARAGGTRVPVSSTTSTTLMRFGISAPGFGDLGQLVARAQWAQKAGFSTFAVSDHLNAASPFVTLQAIA